MYKRFKEFASYEELAKHKNEIEPLVRLCRKGQNEFSTEHQQMKEMIRRFDECISEKANKVGMIELEHRIADLYLPKKSWDQLQDKFEELNGTIGA